MRHRYQGGCRTGSSLLGFNFLLSTLPLFEAAAWTSFGSHQYTHITTKLSWQAARASCQSLAVGGDLVALESAEEEAFVVGTVMNGVVVDTWIGCAYVANAWTWVTTGKSCSDVNSDIYTWWTPNEPTTSEGAAAAVLHAVLSGIREAISKESASGTKKVMLLYFTSLQREVKYLTLLYYNEVC